MRVLFSPYVSGEKSIHKLKAVASLSAHLELNLPLDKKGIKIIICLKYLRNKMLEESSSNSPSFSVSPEKQE